MSIIFKSHSLTQLEEAHGQTLTLQQVQVIENLVAKIAEQKLYLPFTPENPQGFVQQEAYLRGQLDVLNYLLDTSAEASRLITSGEV